MSAKKKSKAAPPQIDKLKRDTAVLIRLEKLNPRRVSETSRHKFNIGDDVVWQASPLAQARSRGTVTVMAHLPPLGEVLQYRIKHAKDLREFVVLEHELSVDASVTA